MTLLVNGCSTLMQQHQECNARSTCVRAMVSCEIFRAALGAYMLDDPRERNLDLWYEMMSDTEVSNEFACIMFLAGMLDVLARSGSM